MSALAFFMIERAKYVCGLYAILMILLGPVDLIFNIGIIDFFLSPLSVLLFIPLWFFAGWLQDHLPFSNK